MFSRFLAHACLCTLFLLSFGPVHAGIRHQQSTPVSFDNALIDAADRGDRVAVMNLVKAGEYVDVRGKFGVTALMRAVFRGDTRMTESLLKLGADPNISDIGGATPLHIAARRGDAAIVSLLMERNAALDAVDHEGWTPLMRASTEGHNEVARLLLEFGADPEVVNDEGAQALHYAVDHENVLLTSKLILAGADLKKEDHDGQSALDLASRKKNEALRTLVFEKANAELYVPPSQRQTVNEGVDVASADATSAPEQPFISVGAPGEVPRTVRLSPEPVVGNPDARADRPLETAQATGRNAVSADDDDSKSYFLQLGSFLERGAAEQQWSTMRTDHPEIFSALEHRISKVVIPPEGRVVYRSQAGVIPTRSQAEEYCSKLKSRNIECFVVESAMVSFGALDETAAEAARTEPTLAEAEAETEAPAPVPSAPPVIAKPQDIGTPRPDSDRRSTRLKTPPSAVNTDPVTPPWMRTEDEHKGDDTAPQDTGTTDDTVDTAEQDGLGLLLAMSAKQPPETPDIPRSAPQPQPKPTPEQIATASVDEVSPVQQTATPERANETLPWLHASSPHRQAMPEPQAHHAHTIASPEPLIPQPSQQHHAARATLPWHQQPQEPLAPAPQTATSTQVEVSEAVRVPVSDQPSRNGISTNVLEARGAPDAITAQHYPSTQAPAKSQWVEIGDFASDRAAIDFWSNTRSQYANHLDLLRTRVIRPMQSRDNRVKLRIGPITSEKDKSGLCAIAEEHRLSCNTVRNLSHQRLTSGRSRIPASVRGTARDYSTYDARTSRRSGGSVFWAQLGSYPTHTEALNMWDDLSETHTDVFADMAPEVSTPARSSARRTLYRLRVGPFSNRLAAVEMCNTLYARRVGCVSVKGR